VSDQDTKEKCDEGCKCQEPPKSWWREHEGKRIAIQLKPGLQYFGFTYPGNFILDEEGNPAAVPFIAGKLKVREDSGDRYWLIVQTQDPDRSKSNAVQEIAIPPEAVLFATVMDQNLIS
jgi:hypothetical protein